MPDDRIVSFTVQGRPSLLNAERSQHWRQHGMTTRSLRSEACLRLSREARVNGEMSMVKIDVWSYYADNRLPDTGACFPAVKAVIDGAVDAGLLPHDGPQIVKHLAFWSPRKDASAGNMLLVTFQQIDKESPWCA